MNKIDKFVEDNKTTLLIVGVPIISISIFMGIMKVLLMTGLV